MRKPACRRWQLICALVFIFGKIAQVVEGQHYISENGSSQFFRSSSYVSEAAAGPNLVTKAVEGEAHTYPRHDSNHGCPPTVSEYPTETAAPSPSPSELPSNSNPPSVTPQPTAAVSESPTITTMPTGFPTESPAPSPSPSEEPTTQPTQSSLPSITPSDSPSWAPSATPTATPSDIPSDWPSLFPSGAPTTAPSSFPTDTPISSPSSVPSNHPSLYPSLEPTISTIPSEIPSIVPSDKPSMLPSGSPTVSPTETPTFVPSNVPSRIPSYGPSPEPSRNPSIRPTQQPSSQPSDDPSVGSTITQSEIPSDVADAVAPDSPWSPSQAPSSRNSDILSGAHSTVPSLLPSSFPTISFFPSSANTKIDPARSPFPSPSLSVSSSVTPPIEPSESSKSEHSNVPVDVPSYLPSRVLSSQPSTSPSDARIKVLSTHGPPAEPSAITSMSPSATTTAVDTNLLTAVTSSASPSMIPSDTSSLIPSGSRAPSDALTLLQDRMVPSFASSYPYGDHLSASPIYAMGTSNNPTFAVLEISSDWPIDAPSFAPSQLRSEESTIDDASMSMNVTMTITPTSDPSQKSKEDPIRIKNDHLNTTIERSIMATASMSVTLKNQSQMMSFQQINVFESVALDFLTFQYSLLMEEKEIKFSRVMVTGQVPFSAREVQGEDFLPKPFLIDIEILFDVIGEILSDDDFVFTSFQWFVETLVDDNADNFVDRLDNSGAFETAIIVGGADSRSEALPEISTDIPSEATAEISSDRPINARSFAPSQSRSKESARNDAPLSKNVTKMFPPTHEPPDKSNNGPVHIKEDAFNTTIKQSITASASTSVMLKNQSQMMNFQQIAVFESIALEFLTYHYSLLLEEEDIRFSQVNATGQVPYSIGAGRHAKEVEASEVSSSRLFLIDIEVLFDVMGEIMTVNDVVSVNFQWLVETLFGVNADDFVARLAASGEFETASIVGGTDKSPKESQSDSRSSSAFSTWVFVSIGTVVFSVFLAVVLATGVVRRLRGQDALTGPRDHGSSSSTYGNGIVEAESSPSMQSGLSVGFEEESLDGLKHVHSGPSPKSGVSHSRKEHGSIAIPSEETNEILRILDSEREPGLNARMRKRLIEREVQAHGCQAGLSMEAILTATSSFNSEEEEGSAGLNSAVRKISRILPSILVVDQGNSGHSREAKSNSDGLFSNWIGQKGEKLQNEEMKKPPTPNRIRFVLDSSQFHSPSRKGNQNGKKRKKGGPVPSNAEIITVGESIKEEQYPFSPTNTWDCLSAVKTPPTPQVPEADNEHEKKRSGFKFFSPMLKKAAVRAIGLASRDEKKTSLTNIPLSDAYVEETVYIDRDFGISTTSCNRVDEERAKRKLRYKATTPLWLSEECDNAIGFVQVGPEDASTASSRRTPLSSFPLSPNKPKRLQRHSSIQIDNASSAGSAWRRPGKIKTEFLSSPLKRRLARAHVDPPDCLNVHIQPSNKQEDRQQHDQSRLTQHPHIDQENHFLPHNHRPHSSVRLIKKGSSLAKIHQSRKPYYKVEEYNTSTSIGRPGSGRIGASPMVEMNVGSNENAMILGSMGDDNGELELEWGLTV